MKRKIAVVLTVLILLTSFSFSFGEDVTTSASAEPAATVQPAAPEPAPAPLPALQPVSSIPATSQEYVVISGDVMWKIAKAHGITLRELIALNPQIKNPDLIFPGQKVTVSMAAQDKVDGTFSTGVLVIGAGGSGLSAANAAIRNGADVLVIEKMPTVGGATAKSGGGFVGGTSNLQKSLGVTGDSVEQIIEDLVKGGEDNYLPLTRLFAENQGQTVDWMNDVLKLPVNKSVTGSVEHKYARSFSMVGGAPAITASLAEAYYSQNGKIMFNTRAEKLVKEGSKIVGVIAQVTNGPKILIKAESVVLATGGYGANKDLLPKEIREILYYGPMSSTGDGIYMAEDVGAQLWYMDHAKVYPQGIETAPGFAKVGTGGSMVATKQSGAIYVNSKGQRVINENLDFVSIKHKTEAEPDKVLYIVLDQAGFDIWKKSAASLLPPDEVDGYVAKNGGTPLFANGPDLKSAAQKAGIDPAALAATVERFNEFCKNGEDKDFGRKELIPLGAGPYYIIEQKLRFASTLGGLKINLSMEVLDEKDQVIPGLYAAGEIVGGVHGKESMPTCNVGWALTSGKLAGDVVSKK